MGQSPGDADRQQAEDAQSEEQDHHQHRQQAAAEGEEKSRCKQRAGKERADHDAEEGNGQRRLPVQPIEGNQGGDVGQAELKPGHRPRQVGLKDEQQQTDHDQPAHPGFPYFSR